MRRKFVTVDVLHITRFYWRPARPDARSQRLENGSAFQNSGRLSLGLGVTPGDGLY